MKKTNLLSNIIFIWSFLGSRRRWQITALFTLMLFSVFAEMMSLGAVIPFLTVLTSPEVIMESKWFTPLIQFLGVTKADELVLPFTVAFISAAIFAAILRTLLLWVNSRLSASMAIQLRTEIYRRTLYRPYEFHISQNSSALISIVTEKVNASLNTAVLQMMHLIIAFFTSLGIVVTLLMINSLAAFLVFVLLGGGYIFFGYLSRKMLVKNSLIVAKSQPLAIKELQEGIGGIRDVLLDHSQKIFISNYAKYIREIQVPLSMNYVISMMPKFQLELFGIILIAILAYYFNANGEDSVPLLGALVLGSQRLLPALQQIYYSWSNILGTESAISDVVNYLKEDLTDYQKISENSEPISFDHEISLNHVSFSYRKSDAVVLNDITISIPKFSKVGFIGPTGCGKSTLLDIIMGLLIPTDGELMVDGHAITNVNRKYWQNQIAHVPQNIYLSDASIEENIAFGIPKEQIDKVKVIDAAKKAHIDYFIQDLPKGYGTYVGERGVQLSGGQRQRIAIARAFYKQASVIVFDEATSALDNKTEEVVMNAVKELNKDFTVLIIAHRINTLKDCDIVYRLEDGKIAEHRI